MNTDATISDKYCFIRLTKVLQLFPVSKATWWNGCKSGKFPKPYKLAPNITAWKLSEIKDMLISIEKRK